MIVKNRLETFRYKRHKNPRSKDFQPGDYLGFNVRYRVIGPNPVLLLSIAHMAFMASDSTLGTQTSLLSNFKWQVNEGRKTAHLTPSTLMPGDNDFFTVFPWNREKKPIVVTQEDLSKLRAGSEILFVFNELTYKDGNKTHHLRQCEWLQPPALAPGIWQFCEVFSVSD
jgi:hypothetical protein